MLEFKPLASSSAGNCYIISGEKSKIMIEAGIPIKKIKEGCGYTLSDVEFCLLSHSHNDHSKSVKEVMAAGIDCYMSRDTANEIKAEGHRLHIIEQLKQFTIGEWSVTPFEVHHDVLNFGYLISNQSERLVFMTDLYYTEYIFPRLTKIAIEANFSNETLFDDDPRRHRLLHSHMSVENCIDFFKANDLTWVQEIWLLHLSSSNGDSEDFKRRIQEATGKVVFIA